MIDGLFANFNSNGLIIKPQKSTFLTTTEMWPDGFESVFYIEKVISEIIWLQYEWKEDIPKIRIF